MSTSWTMSLAAIAVVPMLVTVLFAIRLKRTPDLTFDDRTKAWQVFISLITAFTAVIGGVLVIGKYVDEQARGERDRIAQSRRDRLHNQIQMLTEKKERKGRLYNNAKRVANALVNLDAKDLTSLTKGLERAEFEQLYWGQLIGVESRRVESAMVELRRALQSWSEDQNKPSGLEQLVLNLSQACADDLNDVNGAIAALNDQVAQVGVSASTSS
jgi:hypothetical protein